MTQEEFVDMLSAAARERVLEDLRHSVGELAASAAEPPVAAAARWLAGLSPEDRRIAEQALAIVAYHTVRSVLDVLDGLIKVEPPGERGRFVLTFVEQAGATSSLAGPGQGPLNELIV